MSGPRIHTLTDAPPAVLAQRLDAFERQFTYPLGPGRSFRISHGDDYPRFYRSIGTAAVFALEVEDAIVGTIGVALRELITPDGKTATVAYLGDLKVAPEARGGRALPRLMAAVHSWVGNRTTQGIGVVMDGTPITPAKYTGRLGVPLFEELGKVVVLRIGEGTVGTDVEPAERREGEALFSQLSAGGYACACQLNSERSKLKPLWYMLSNGHACGILEDTLLAKHLIANDGIEMVSAHVSCFACASPREGARFLEHLASLAKDRGYPALFVSVPESDAAPLCSELKVSVVKAPATVYGTRLSPSSKWTINTAEI